MRAPPEALRAALAGRYEIERERGGGGMAAVFLARDLKRHRQVTIKVVKPELAASLGAERFLREIDTAASLTHPHILPVHDSGEANGFLYYVMPFVEGESLRDRLAREGQLPLDGAPRPVTDLRPAVPGWVVMALRRALAKAPADRFNPVAQFAEALAHHDADSDPTRVAATPVRAASAVAASAPPRRRRRWAMGRAP